MLAELIKGIIWDGGFKEMCMECGYKKDVNQWQDIQCALHEVLLTHTILSCFMETSHLQTCIPLSPVHKHRMSHTQIKVQRVKIIILAKIKLRLRKR